MNRNIFVLLLITIPCFLCSVFCPLNSVFSEDWPQEMGPTRTGYTSEEPTISKWGSEGPKVLWRANVGYASAPVAVVNGRVFAFGAYKAGAALSESMKKEDVAWYGWSGVGGGNAATPGKGMGPKEHISTWAFAFEEATGKRLWATQITADLVPKNDIDWSQAPPLVSDGKVYIHTFYGVLAALDCKTGDMLWRVDLSEAVKMGEYHTKAGNMCSPLLLPGGMIAVSHGAPDCGGTVNKMQASAFDIKTGKLIWTSETFTGGFRSNQSSMFLADLQGKPTVLLSTGGQLAGLNPADGSRLWLAIFKELIPEFGRTRVAYEQHRKKPELARALFEKQVPGGGEEEWKKFQEGISVYRCTYPNRMPMAWEDHVIDGMYIWHQMKDSQTFSLRITKDGPQLAWQAPELNDTRGYFVVHDGKVYGMDHQEGGFNIPGTRFFDMRPYHQRPPRPKHIKQFQCYDIKSGKLEWSSDVLTRGNPEEGTNLYAGSGRFIIAGDCIIFWGREGLRIARIRKEGGLELLAEYAHGGGYPSVPVFANGRLYLRKLKPNTDPKRDRFFYGGKANNLIVLDLSASAK